MTSIHTKRLEYLETYVRDADACKKDSNCKLAIQKLIEEDGDVITAPITVYRGHTHTSEIRTSVPWFSVSLDKSLAEGYTGKDCCLFIIHLMPGVQYIDVKEMLEHTNYTFEEEYIVKGGGVFTEKHQISPGVYEMNYLPLNYLPEISTLPPHPVSSTSAAKASNKTPVTLNILKERAERNGFIDVNNDIEFLTGAYLYPSETLVSGGSRKLGCAKTQKQKA